MLFSLSLLLLLSLATLPSAANCETTAKIKPPEASAANELSSMEELNLKSRLTGFARSQELPVDLNAAAAVATSSESENNDNHYDNDDDDDDDDNDNDQDDQQMIMANAKQIQIKIKTRELHLGEQSQLSLVHGDFKERDELDSKEFSPVNLINTIADFNNNNLERPEAGRLLASSSAQSSTSKEDDHEDEEANLVNERPADGSVPLEPAIVGNSAHQTRRSACERADENKCKDYNALCHAGQCICRPGYFSHRLTAGHCRPLQSWLNNCDSDDQCQAFNSNLICDTSLHERSFCNCVDGFYFDLQQFTCVACSNSTNASSDSNSTYNFTEPAQNNNDTQQQQNLPPCKPNDRLNAIRREILLGHSSSQDLQPHKSSRSFGTSFLSHPSGVSGSAGSASDPYRIKTPLEVFMGAIILFTLFTVTWFFLQRMIHDCRSIMRSLRNPDYANNCTDLNFTVGPLTSLTTNRDGVTTATHLQDSSATSQAIARIIANEAQGGNHLTSIYQRNLAYVLMQHLTRNLNQSNSTGHSLTIGPDGLVSEHEGPNLFPLIRGAALPGGGTASQLILSPSNRAITILQSPAFDEQLAAEYGQINLINSAAILSEPPPPKYEEAISQTNAIGRDYADSSLPSNPAQPQQDTGSTGPEQTTPTSPTAVNRNSASDAEASGNSNNNTQTPAFEHNIDDESTASNTTIAVRVDGSNSIDSTPTTSANRNASNHR